MIKTDSLTAAGVFTKTHGIKGELNATLSIEPEYLDSHDCFVCDVDGINVPFFVSSIRSKGSTSVLIKPDGVDSETEARDFVGKTIYVDRLDYARFREEEIDENDGGGYADDFIGYTVIDDEMGEVGEITDLETSTDNALFILKPPTGDHTIYVPVVEEFITEIDDNNRIIKVSLPAGLVDLNK